MPGDPGAARGRTGKTEGGPAKKRRIVCWGTRVEASLCRKEGNPMGAHRHQLAFSVLTTGVTLTMLVVMVAAQPASPPTADPNLDSEGKPLPGTTIPCAPIAEKRQELGCYIAARQRLGALPQDTPLSWHLDAFSTRAPAEADKGPLGV